MKNIFNISVAIIAIVAVVFACDDRAINLEKVNVPFSFTIDQNNDSVGTINEVENFTGAITIGEFNGPKDGRKFYLSTKALNPALTGTFKINNKDFVDGQAATEGSLVMSYVSDQPGLHKLLISVRNEAGKVQSDTFICNIKAFKIYPFDIVISPKDFTSPTLKPGTTSAFNLKVNSADITGTRKYYLSYQNLTTNGQSSVFATTNTIYTNGAEMSSRTLNVFLNIPQSHPDGDYKLQIKVQDENGDFKLDTMKYTVKANVKPVVTSLTATLKFDNALATESANSSCWSYGCYLPYSARNISNPMFYVGTNLSIDAAFNDPDGSITAIKIVINGVLTQTAYTTNTYNKTLALGNSYWQKYNQNLTSGTCGTFYEVYPVNGKQMIGARLIGCSTTTFSEWSVAPGTAISFQVQDNEGVWSDAMSIATPDYTQLLTTKPSNVHL